MDTVKRYKRAGLPAAYTSASRLVKRLRKKQTIAEVRQSLAGEPSYTLHRQVKYKFPRRRLIVGGPNCQYQADLVDVSNISSENDGMKYLLCVIDVFSKFAWVKPLRNKSGKTVALAFEYILDIEAKRAPFYCQTDKGSEFKSHYFQRVLRDRGIRYFVTENQETKAQTVERFQRSLQDLMHRHFTASSSRRYIEILPLLVKTYNTTEHSTVRMTPTQASKYANAEKVWANTYDRGKYKEKTKPKLKINDKVRISKAKRHFRKGYLGSWSEEIFTIRKIINTMPITYEIEDWDGEEIKGSFYEQELQKIKPPVYFDVEKVLKERKDPKTGSKSYLVKWRGYPSSLNSWVKDLIIKGP